MIQNEAHYQATLKSLELLRKSVAHLKEDMLPKSERWFAIMASGPLEDIAKMQAEIDEYLGIAKAENLQAEVWMHIEGPSISWPQAATSVMTDFLENFRTGIQQITEFVKNGALSGSRPTEELRTACDFRIMGLKPGSLRVGLSLPAVTMEGIDTPTRDRDAEKAIGDFLLAAAKIEESEDAVDAAVVNPTYRRVVLNALKSLAPRPRGSVESVGFSGWRVSRPTEIILNRASAARLDAAIKRTSTSQDPAVNSIGLVRKIDLDDSSIRLWHPSHPDISCKIPEELMEVAKNSLDRWVKVIGTGRRRGTNPNGAVFVDAVTLDVLEEAPEDARLGPAQG